jgi:putative FmdB family regulatory protein
MPLYEFACEEHGVFEVRRPIGQAADPVPCVHCERPAARVFTPPLLRSLSPAVREGLAREERSRHEPRIASHAELGRSPAAEPPPPRWHTSRGRPWMLGG